jgi:hypothetical protein
MSALRSFQQLNPGTVPGGVVQVPRSYQPDVDRALMEANAREFEFPASSGTFQETQTSQIMIPQAMNRYILGGSLYLQFSLDVTGTKTAAQGSNSLIYFTGGPTKSAAALIDRITISSSGGAILADIQNYANWHNLVLAHSSNVGYKHDASILEYAYSGVGLFMKADASVTHKVDISLPISIGLFNQVKAFPLWACNGPLVINIVWAPNVNCLGMCDIQEEIYTRTTSLKDVDDTTATTFTITPLNDQFTPTIIVPALTVEDVDKTGLAPTSTYSLKYSGNSLVVRCMCSDVDSEYVAEQRAQMAQGKLLTYHYEDVRSMQTNSGGASINFGINCSSLISVFGLQQMAADRAVIGTVPTSTSYGQDCTGSWGWSQNLVQNIRVFRDGTQLSTFPLLQSGKDDAFAPLQSALGILFSTSNSTQCMRYDGKRMAPGKADNARNARQTNDSITQGTVTSQINLSTSFDLPPAWACTKAGFSAAADKHYGGGSIFAPHAFCWGLSARKCNDADISNPGSAVSQLQVTVDGNVGSGTSNSASVHYIYYVYHASASFDISGNVAVRR